MSGHIESADAKTTLAAVFPAGAEMPNHNVTEGPTLVVCDADGNGIAVEGTPQDWLRIANLIANQATRWMNDHAAPRRRLLPEGPAKRARELRIVTPE